MKHEIHKSPWFLTIVGFAIFGIGYKAGDDNRIEREQKQTVQVSKVVKSNYAKEPGK